MTVVSTVSVAAARSSAPSITPTSKHLASGRITPEQALTHPNRNVLLTSLGGQEDPRFDYGETDDLAAGDAFLLCSDGLLGLFRRSRTWSHHFRQFGASGERDADRHGAASGQRGRVITFLLAIIKLNEALLPEKPKPTLPPGFVPRSTR